MSSPMPERDRQAVAEEWITPGTIYFLFRYVRAGQIGLARSFVSDLLERAEVEIRQGSPGGMAKGT